MKATAHTTHSDTAALTGRRRQEAQDLLSSAVHGQFRATLAATTTPDLHLLGPQGQQARGRDALADFMDADLHAGVRQRLSRITAGTASPSSSADQRIDNIRLFHPNVEAAT